MRVIKSGIEIRSKKNIAEKMQNSVYNVTEKFQNRYEKKKQCLSLNPKLWQKLVLLKFSIANLFLPVNQTALCYKIASSIILYQITFMY